MAKTNPSVIILKGNPQYREYPLAPISASGVTAITPGMLVELASGEVRPHTTQGGDAVPMFAVEGLNIDASSQTMGDIDTDYDDDNGAVKVARCNHGDVVYALLVAGESVAADELLQSASDGYLMGYNSSSPTPLRAVGRAVDAVDNSAGTTPARVKVEVL